MKTEAELKAVPDGAVIQNKRSGTAYVVIGHTKEGWPILAFQLTATNPAEWEVVPPQTEPVTLPAYGPNSITDGALYQDG